MRKLIILLLLIFALPLVNKAQLDNENYDRLSTTHILVLYSGDKYNDDIKKLFLKQKRSDKYNEHQVSKQILHLPIEAKYLREAEKMTYILESLKKEEIPKLIIEKWYSRESNGNMNLSLIHSRGRYNADDYDYSDAQLTKRGSTNLKDYGNKLIDKTYIIVSEIDDIESAREWKNSKSHGYTSKNHSYVFKLDFNPIVREKIYETWIYDDDPQETKDNKNLIFQKINFPLKNITHIYKKLDYTQSNENKNNIFFKYKSDSELFTEMINASYHEVMQDLSTNFEDFMVKTYIEKTSPLSAKIGLKESLSVDQRFFVYEFIWDESKDKAIAKRKAIIRASKISDNRRIAEGHSLSSNFYQTAGWSIEKGMLIEQKNDLGISLTAGWENGVMGGFALRADMRTGSLTNIPALYIFADLNLSNKEYDIFSKENSVTFTKFTVGIAKGFNFAYNFELIPFVSYGMEYALFSESVDIENNDSEDRLNTNLFKIGSALSMNLTHNIQVFGNISYYLTFGDVTAGKDTKLDMSWTDIFEDRKGITSMLGLRILF